MECRNTYSTCQSLRIFMASLVLILTAAFSSAAASNENQSASILVLDFELNDLTLYPDTENEEKRVKTLRPLLAEELKEAFSHSIASLPQQQRDQEDKGKGYIFDRPKVAARMARAADAQWVVSGRLHKASFLFVYLLAQLINAETDTVSANFAVEIKGWEPRLTEEGIDTLALQIDESLRTLDQAK